MAEWKHETFNDGICRIYSTDEADRPLTELRRYRMQERLVGMARYYAAMQATRKINRLIRIPQALWLLEEYKVVIGTDVYEIVQIQHNKETMPPTTDLTLYRLGCLEGVAQP